MSVEEYVVQHVQDAYENERQLCVVGTGSKRRWLPQVDDGELLSTDEMSGVIDYQAEELVITVRAGTPLKEVVQILAHKNQQFYFEPPQYYGDGTIGGMISSGLSGPATPWSGAVRDAVLGVELVNGYGEKLNFGGQVMKNVAGYDVSRLVTGAFGSLGLILSASIRVQPRVEYEETIRFAMDGVQAVDFCRSLARQNLPISATWWAHDNLWIRLSGTQSGVFAAVKQLGGEVSKTANLWRDIRDHKIEFFLPASLSARKSQNGRNVVDEEGHKDNKLCRVMLPPASQFDGALLPGVEDDEVVVEHGGGLRWVWLDDAQALRRQVAAVGGWVWVLG